MTLQELLPVWAIVCPLVFLAGLIDSVAGGGGLISLPAYLIAGLPAPLALGTNKCDNAFGTFLATGRFIQRKQLHVPTAAAAALAALVGSALGSQLAMRVAAKFLNYLLLAVVPILGGFILFQPQLGAEDKTGRHSPKVLMAICVGIGFVVGGYDGFFGPGAGTFMMLAFTTLAGFDLLRASGNTKVVNSASNAASLVTFALAGQVVWAVGVPAALCNILGNYIGSGLALKGGAKVIRPMFFVVLGLLAVKLVSDLL